ncbi:MAG: YdcF family protein, partial [Gammaproteobacteria bacterium]|nr:YdcF family protein [Gammaproteobacteria bacterium]
MGQEIVWVVKALLLPPGGIILLGVFGLIMGGRSLAGRFLITLSLAALYLFSTPYIANRMMAEVETFPALSPTEIQDNNAEAIVVLGGGRRNDTAEFGGDTVNGLLLERLRYAAY